MRAGNGMEENNLANEDGKSFKNTIEFGLILSDPNVGFRILECLMSFLICLCLLLSPNDMGQCDTLAVVIRPDLLLSHTRTFFVVVGAHTITY